MDVFTGFEKLLAANSMTPPSTVVTPNGAVRLT